MNPVYLTPEYIREAVATKPEWAARAVVALYHEQTAAEQMTEATSEKNGRGFNGTDAEILTSFAKQIERGRTLSVKQLAIAFKKLPKYAKQLARIAQENEANREARRTTTPKPAPKPQAEPKASEEFNRAWLELKNAFAEREREQEYAAFASDPDYQNR